MGSGGWFCLAGVSFVLPVALRVRAARLAPSLFLRDLDLFGVLRCLACLVSRLLVLFWLCLVLFGFLRVGPVQIFDLIQMS